MKTTVTLHDFRDAFNDSGRGTQFSYNGLEALFDFIEEMDEGSGTETELDVIALCCDFSEHDSALACVTDLGYDFTPEEDDDEEEQEEAALEYLRDNTLVLEFSGGVIIQGF